MSKELTPDLCVIGAGAGGLAAASGAAARGVPVVLIERMQTELDFDIVLTAYGLTEASGFGTMCRPDDDPVTVATTLTSSTSMARRATLPSAALEFRPRTARS